MPPKQQTLLNKSDLHIIVALILAGAVCWLFYRLYDKSSDGYRIRFLDKTYSDIIANSNTNNSVNINGKFGPMILEFDKEKGARVASSTCSCQVCVGMGWSKNVSIICVPNAVMIEPLTESKASGAAVDAVSR